MGKSYTRGRFVWISKKNIVGILIILIIVPICIRMNNDYVYQEMMAKYRVCYRSILENMTLIMDEIARSNEYKDSINQRKEIEYSLNSLENYKFKWEIKDKADKLIDETTEFLLELDDYSNIPNLEVCEKMKNHHKTIYEELSIEDY